MAKRRRTRRRKGKFFFPEPLKKFTKEESERYMEENVFNNDSFLNHISRTAEALNIDEEVVSDVIKFYLGRIFILLNTVQRVRRVISVYGFFYLYIEKGERV